MQGTAEATLENALSMVRTAISLIDKIQPGTDATQEEVFNVESLSHDLDAAINHYKAAASK